MIGAELTAARVAAFHTRGEYILLVAQGLMTPEQVIEQAALPEHEVLKPLRLQRLHEAVPGNGKASVRRFVRELAIVAGSSTAPTRLTVGWLLDRRAGGRRLIAYANLLHPAQAPWPGFPHRAPIGEAR